MTGHRWTCKAGHNGWNPSPPRECPKCGGKISGSLFRKPTAKEYAAWVKREAKG